MTARTVAALRRRVAHAAERYDAAAARGDDRWMAEWEDRRLAARYALADIHGVHPDCIDDADGWLCSPDDDGPGEPAAVSPETARAVAEYEASRARRAATREAREAAARDAQAASDAWLAEHREEAGR